MHLYTITRGIKNDVDNFINDLQAMYLPYKCDGKLVNLQLSVRPIQLWELVMPEPELPTVMKALWDINPGVNKRHKFFLNRVRNILGAKKIPQFDEKIPRRIIRNQNVAIYPVGIKPDNYNPGNESI